ncbi:hypothetical protein H257_08265 [Aphanomyces astaci]|uniref:Uncharacterized protein n=1 Tax=Aphanomyces astaci TaxID=112090 RepID=W4GEF2_APHAT|nr:hypothetical protein H257_08265 [Aphanomyces astaci]ETV78052.1 hypothetical protein H257_08265 [Aphanomyces astaci]|eukprot:XP_009832389.1 hypothetical protein H257_08265 [Aphanomyces astaci]
MHVHYTMKAQTSWLQATLVVDPVAMRHGYEWLSDRIYHAAATAKKFHRPLGTSVDDAAGLTLHTREADDDRTVTIAAMETHSQHTILHNFEAVSNAMRTCMGYGRNSLIFSEVQSLSTWWTAGKAFRMNTPERLHLSRRLGTSLRNVVRFYYPTSTVVLITYCSVLGDETHPRVDGSRARPHGFAWCSRGFVSV